MLRSPGPVVWLFIALVAGCASDDPDLERRGGPLPDPSGDGGSGQGTAGSDSGPIVPFCDALAVIRAKCQRCHGDPVAHGAPVSFLTYEDTQGPYYTTDSRWWEVMITAVTKDFMPYVALNEPPTSIMPPVEPLTPDEKATLLGWLHQGAKPEGGTDCPD
jgi:hypothetical protein